MDWAKRSEVSGRVQMVSSIGSVVIGGEGMRVRVCLASYKIPCSR